MAEQTSLSLTWWETPEDTFCHVVAHIISDKTQTEQTDTSDASILNLLFSFPSNELRRLFNSSTLLVTSVEGETVRKKLNNSIKIQKLSSFKSNENIHKREDGSYYVVSANKASSVTL